MLPLLSRDAKQLRLHLTARRDVSLGTNTFPLPELLGSVVLDGSLSVESNSSIRLTPDSRGTKGLSSIPLDESVTSARDGEIKEGTHQQRYRTFLSQPVMIADVAIRKRQNSVEMNSSISLTETVAQVSQVLQYDVKYHPSSQLLLRIPEELWLNRSLEVHVDGQEAAFGLGINSNDSNYDAIEKTEKIDFSLRQMIVTLPRPLLGSFKLELDYKLPIPELAKGSVASFVLPLIVPEGNLKRNTLIISAESQIQLTLGRLSAEGQWTTLAPGIAGTSSDTLQLSSLTKPSALPLLLHRESSEDRELVMLEQAWLQSWVAGGLQQDRAVFLFRTSDSHAFIQLPPNQPEVAVELILDGLAVETPLFAEGRLAVALDDSAPQTKHTLELRYQRPVALGSWRNLVTELPYLECRPTSSPVYWQLILPRGWQIVSSPEKLSPDYWLGWKDYHWGRQPTHLQEDLQRITNATFAPPPPLSTTQYTFRAFQLPQQVEVVIVRKVWLIAAFTLLAFGIGVLLFKTQLARQGVFWLTVAALLFGTSFLFPEVTLITVQTILWGGLLTLSFVVLRSVFGADAQAVRGSSGSVARHSTTATESWDLPQSGLDANDEDAATTLQSGGSSR